MFPSRDTINYGRYREYTRGMWELKSTHIDFFFIITLYEIFFFKTLKTLFNDYSFVLNKYVCAIKLDFSLQS